MPAVWPRQHEQLLQCPFVFWLVLTLWNNLDLSPMHSLLATRPPTTSSVLLLLLLLLLGMLMV